MKAPALFLAALSFSSPSFADSYYRCNCVSTGGQIVCGSSDFGSDPDGFNIPGSLDPEKLAERMCQEMHPELETISCRCSAN